MHKNRAKITERFAYVLSKNCPKFRFFAHLCKKANSRKFWRKSGYLCISLFPAISWFRAISLFCLILRNKSRKWWINSKLNQSESTILQPASVGLGHKTVLFTVYRLPAINLIVTHELINLIVTYELINKSHSYSWIN